MEPAGSRVPFSELHLNVQERLRGIACECVAQLDDGYADVRLVAAVRAKGVINEIDVHSRSHRIGARCGHGLIRRGDLTRNPTRLSHSAFSAHLSWRRKEVPGPRNS